MEALIIGSASAIAKKQRLVAEANAAGNKVEACELEPSGLCKGCIGKIFSKLKLRKLMSTYPDGLIVLVEEPGDVAWEPWMVYAAGSGMRPIAVPARLKGVENINGVRSGVAIYDKMETLSDLETAEHAAMWECQKLAVAR